MEVYRSTAAFRKARRAAPGSVGLVPTMGYLHQGHLSLVRRARAENETCAVWVFVNPMQFGPQEDYRRYPREEAGDSAILEREGVDLLFLPGVEEIYPEGFGTYVEVRGVTERLEGAFRPGHFLGVATVVLKFFHIMEPTRAYFGRKDAQQAVAVKKMVRDLNMDVQIVVCPTVREADGLAMSSRNRYLTPDERRAAPVLYRSLRLAQERWAAGLRDAEAIRCGMTALIQSEPLANIDYVSVAHPETLEELDAAVDGALVSLAVRFGATRLIDNVTLGQ